MMSFRKCVVVAALMCVGLSSALAQAESTSPRQATVYVPGLMTGPGSFGPIGFRRLCDLRVVGLAEWKVAWIERTLRLTPAQKSLLDALQLVSSQAKADVAAGCGSGHPATSVAQLGVMDKRLDAVVKAFKAVKPAYDAFYAALDMRQQAQLDRLGPNRGGWRW